VYLLRDKMPKERYHPLVQHSETSLDVDEDERGIVHENLLLKQIVKQTQKVVPKWKEFSRKLQAMLLTFLTSPAAGYDISC
jgi:hypothetical protein